MQKREPRPRRRTTRRVFSTLLFFFLLCSCLGLFATGMSFSYCRFTPLPRIPMEQSTVLVDDVGEVLTSEHRLEKRRSVTYEQISPDFFRALVAIEDQRFYDHFGIDLQAIVRALWVNLQHGSWKQGASTITQQLARNAFLSHERTWNRKLRELVYTCQLEAQLTKKQILTLYANKVYFGHGHYGIESASSFYFRKSARSLALPEAALLAGIVRSWKYYSPHANFVRSNERKLRVLHTMHQQGKITARQWSLAQTTPIRLAPITAVASTHASHFVQYVRTQVDQAIPADPTGHDSGLTVYTTLNARAQRIALSVLSRHLAAHPDVQAALVAIDPRTGFIKAMVGGRPDKPDAFNRVLSTSRQPGSTFKPIVYLTALEEKKMTALTRYRSAPTIFRYDQGRKQYAPKNYANQYVHEDIDLRTAIARSDNIYAVHTLLDLGTPLVASMAQKLGIRAPLTSLPSLALGVSPISPLEMAVAYATIASGGVYRPPVAITHIDTTSGYRLFQATPTTRQAVSAPAAYVLTQLLQSVFAPGGTGHRVADVLKRPIAGKTGTTNTDAWAVGFTPELVTAVWIGYDRNRPIATPEARLALPIFARFTEEVMRPVPPKPFHEPDGVVTVYVDVQSGKLAQPGCEPWRLESFIASTEPTTFCSIPSTTTPSASPQNTIEQSQRHSWWQDVLRWWSAE